ncbi:MAG: hypothetical protein U1E27_12625 [Kiritimatiellia bacterium]|nr:hypothetical protein [Kiritimatiellia bacterium]
MSDLFWPWLIRRHTSRYVYAALVLLMGTSAWWIFRQSASEDPPAVGLPGELPPDPAGRTLGRGPTPVVAPPPSGVQTNPFASLSIAEQVRALEEERAAKRRADAERAAQLKAEEEERARLEAERIRQELAALLPDAESRPLPPPVVVPPPEPLPPRPSRLVMYRGLVIRPDGTVLGLVEDQTSGLAAYYALGDSLAGRPVSEIGRRELRLGKEDPTGLPLGESVTIQDYSP